MTDQPENGSRLDRIEAILLNLAGASVRHDNEFSRINAILDRNAQQIESLTHRIEANSHQIEANSHQIEENTRLIEATTRQGALNQESIQNLTASIQDLRNLVADYIQGRAGN